MSTFAWARLSSAASCCGVPLPDEANCTLAFCDLMWAIKPCRFFAGTDGTSLYRLGLIAIGARDVTSSA
jgi:hypothetical protein